jgi:hypothetical protein
MSNDLLWEFMFVAGLLFITFPVRINKWKNFKLRFLEKKKKKKCKYDPSVYEH